MLLSIVFSVNNLDSNQDIIHLNVEGTHYTTTRGTLDYYKIKFKPSWGEPRLYELV